jgi:hypothetical protein
MRIPALQWIILLSLSIFSISCSKILGPEAYVSWVKNPDNGLRVINRANGFVFDVQYKTPELNWIESGNGSLKEVIQHDDALQYLQLTIKPEKGMASILQVNAGSQQELQQNLYYYAYLFERDIFLEIDGEKFPCTLFHFERGVDLKPERTFSLGFDAPKPKNGMATLLIQAERLSALPIRIKIDLSKIPILKV